MKIVFVIRHETLQKLPMTGKKHLLKGDWVPMPSRSKSRGSYINDIIGDFISCINTALLVIHKHIYMCVRIHIHTSHQVNWVIDLNLHLLSHSVTVSVCLWNIPLFLWFHSLDNNDNHDNNEKKQLWKNTNLSAI